jgi:hypothetical protein
VRDNSLRARSVARGATQLATWPAGRGPAPPEVPGISSLAPRHWTPRLGAHPRCLSPKSQTSRDRDRRGARSANARCNSNLDDTECGSDGRISAIRRGSITSSARHVAIAPRAALPDSAARGAPARGAPHEVPDTSSSEVPGGTEWGPSVISPPVTGGLRDLQRSGRRLIRRRRRRSRPAPEVPARGARHLATGHLATGPTRGALSEVPDFS